MARVNTRGESERGDTDPLPPPPPLFSAASFSTANVVRGDSVGGLRLNLTAAITSPNCQPFKYRRCK